MTSNLKGFDITLPATILEKWHRTIRYDALLYISKYYTVTNCSAAFETQQVRIPHITVYYLRRHILNHVGDYIALNYTIMTHRVGIYYGAVVFYRDLTRKTVSDIKSEWFWHLSSRNNIRKNDTGITGTMHYDIFPRTTLLQTVLLHSIHCKHQIRILLVIIFVYKN